MQTYLILSYGRSHMEQHGYPKFMWWCIDRVKGKENAIKEVKRHRKEALAVGMDIRYAY